jgi:RND family efflux transporter MFP subunit
LLCAMLKRLLQQLRRKRAAHVVALAAMATAGCGEQVTPAPPPPTVTLATPLQRNVVDWDEYIGRFEADQDVQIVARVSGPIARVGFADGALVQPGQMLFTIDPRPFQAALAEAEASTASARAGLTNAAAQAERGTALLAADAISREENDNLAAALRTARATLAAAQARQRAADLDLSFTQVRAPIAGRVSDRRVDVGDFVTAGQTQMTRVVRIDPIRFRFDGAEAFYLKYVRQDAAGSDRRSSRTTPNPIEIQLADEPDFRWQGRMRFIDSGINPETGTINAYALVPNPDGFLVPGLFGRARLLGSGTYRAMLVPDEAIITDQTRKLVYVVGRDNKVAPRPVATGPMVEGLRVIRDGLTPTDRLVIDGLARLQPGMAVTPRRGTIRVRAKNDAPVARPVTAPASSQATTR